MPLEEVMKEVRASKEGLQEEEAKQRLHKYGKNMLQEGKKRVQ